MKSLIILLVFALAAASGFCATTKKAPAVKPGARQPAADAVPTAKIQAAATAAVKAHVKAQMVWGDSRTKLQSTTVAPGSTTAVAGWSNRYRTTGAVTLVLATAGKRVEEKRTYEALSEVSSSGDVTIADLSVR